MGIRLLTLFTLIIGAFIAPWWAVAIGIAICALAYRNFLEALIPALILDVLYGAHPIFGIPGFITLSTAALLVLSLLAESSIRGHVRI
ncbi:MAG: hypothetical protein QG633_248 [Patescibacteria group bacterium]|jgi:hypothetical protein|nr:hypothetical protein [Patescibacteria group bacterium]